MKNPNSTKEPPELPECDTLVIAHQDGDLLYRMTRGGFSIARGTISISVETEAVKEDQFPQCAHLALERHPFNGPLRPGELFEGQGGMFDDRDEGSAMAHGYFSFHAERISVRWTVQAVEGDVALFRLEATHDDVNYYDGRAKRTPTRGLFRLARKPRSRIWIPS